MTKNMNKNAIMLFEIQRKMEIHFWRTSFYSQWEMAALIKRILSFSIIFFFQFFLFHLIVKLKNV